MSNLMNELESKEKEWLEYADKAARFLKTAPDGNVKCNRCGGKYTQFLISRKDDEPPRQYAGADKKELVSKLVQKEYCRQILGYLNPALRKLQSFMKWYRPDQLTEIYDHLPEARKKLIVPVRMPDDAFVTEWLNNLKSHENSYPLEDNILTNKNESVRSKSEKIIADKLCELGIPYVYEASLTLKGFGTVYPDFTILNIRTRQTFYYEHFGCMNDPEYQNKTFRKIAAYENNNLWFGDGLLYTFESDTIPMNMLQLNRMIQRYLL